LIHEYELRGDPEELARERKEIINKLLDSEVNYVKGFQEFFHLIKGDYKTCIASSIDYELLEIIDRHLELRKLFGNRVYIISDVNCPSKPDPCIFNYAAKKLESEQKNCVVIEDSPNGIKAAKAAGMKCIAIATTHEREKLTEADIIVNSFEDIIEYLGAKRSLRAAKH
jgi:beta-phosphoglucomutase-like phosphatase (HAD superfamily)